MVSVKSSLKDNFKFSNQKSIIMKKLFCLLAFFMILFSTDALAQQALKSKPKVESMPEFVVIKASDSSGLSKMQINIQIKKKSRYRLDLLRLEEWLYDQQGIRTTSDLMNVMFEIGYEYQNAFLASTNPSANVDYNMVFRNIKN